MLLRSTPTENAWPGVSEISSLRCGLPLQFFSQQHMYVLLCMRTSLCTVDAEAKVVSPQQTHVLFCAIRISVLHPFYRGHPSGTSICSKA